MTSRALTLPAPPSRRPVVSEAARFLLVGGVSTVADVGTFNLLHYGAGTGPLTAKVLSTVVGGVTAFVGNRQLTFGGAGEGRMRRQAMAFLVVNAAALLLALVLLAVARYGLGLTGVVALNVAGNVVGLAFATVLRFWGYRRWVFAAPKAGQAGLPARETERARLAA